MSRVLKVKDWKEKGQAQFIPQYCPMTFMKQAMRISDGSLFRTDDIVWVPILHECIIINFVDDRINVILKGLHGSLFYNVTINEINLVRRPTDKEIIASPDYTKKP